MNERDEAMRRGGRLAAEDFALLVPLGAVMIWLDSAWGWLLTGVYIAWISRPSRRRKWREVNAALKRTV